MLRIIKEYCWVGYNIAKRVYRKVADPLKFSLVLVVGQACNLKCVNCGNFCPVSLPETRRYDVNSIIKSLDTVYQNIHKIRCLQIQGGGPFVYSDLVKLMNWLRDKKKIEIIEIATNGMLIPSEDVLNTLKSDKRIRVRISDYGISGIAKEFKAILDKMEIRNYYYKFAGGKGEWHNLGGVDIMPVSDREKKKHFNTCAFNTCRTLENGELTYCSRAANAYKLQNFVRDDRDFLRVEDSRDFRRKLKKFIRNPHAMEACRHCNGTVKGEKIIPAIQPLPPNDKEGSQ